MTPPPDLRLGLVDRLLSYANTPGRVIALIVLALFGVVCWTLYEQRATIATRILEKTVVPRLEPQRFPESAARLLTETDADLVILSRVDLASNLTQNIDGRLRTNAEWRPRPLPRAMFGSDLLATGQIVELIEGHVVCEDVHPVDHVLETAEVGMARFCMAPVPPLAGVLVGDLLLGWRTPPGAAAELGIKRQLIAEAMQLAVW